ncbi:MAG: hypothetical protein DRO40_03410 [Thermoprotei archaeon]|nr:MAG: hypothetical protein DRO40_03410 [Thermoprotei archaeon]
MAETIESSQTIIPYQETKDLLYAVAGLLSITSAYYDIANNEQEKEEAKYIIKGLIDKWLEKLSPIPYINGLTDELSEIVKRKLWEAVPDITENLFERILVETIIFKNRALAGDDEVVLETLADTLSIHTVLLLESLHGSRIEWRNYPVIKSIIWDTTDTCTKIQKLASIVAISLVLSTN